jgi:hypothetical protein
MDNLLGTAIFSNHEGEMQEKEHPNGSISSKIDSTLIN